MDKVRTIKDILDNLINRSGSVECDYCDYLKLGYGCRKSTKCKYYILVDKADQEINELIKAEKIKERNKMMKGLRDCIEDELVNTKVKIVIDKNTIKLREGK